MSEILVKTNIMAQCANSERDLTNKLNNLAREIESVQSGLSFNVKSRAKIGSQLSSLIRVTQRNSEHMLSLSNVLANAVSTYSSTEKRIAENATGATTELNKLVSGYKDKTDPLDILKEIQEFLRLVFLGYTTASSESVWDKFWAGDLGKLEGSIWEKFSKDEESFRKFLTGTLSATLTSEYGKYKKDDAFNDVLNDFLKSKGWSPLPEQKKKNGIQIGEDESFYKKTGTIFEEKTERKVEGSVLYDKLSGESDYAKGSIEGKFLTGEAHANASGGFYVYEKDKDGNVKRIFSPGVSAEVGASASVLELKGEGRLGLGEDKNMLGVYGEVEGKALTAEATAKAAFNKNEAFVGASAEADIVKVTAKGGVSVLGADVGVTGSVKVGVGAHANAGYTDGKLKVDLGVAVGVGVDIGFEVDVGGTVDAVCDGAKAAWEGVTGFFGSLF